MRNLVTILTITLAIWWTFLWGIVATVAIFGRGLPDVGSIISLHTTSGTVVGVVLVGLLGLGLLWAALRSLKGTMALTTVTLLVLVTSFLIPRVGDVAMLMWPTLLLLPLLWYRHRSVPPGNPSS